MTVEPLPAVRIAFREHRLYINQATLICLGNPPYLQLLFEDERKLLAIVGSIESKENLYKIPYRIYRDADDECCVSRKVLTEAFRQRMNLDKRENYRITGEYSPNIGMVIFDFTKAIIVNRGR